MNDDLVKRLRERAGKYDEYDWHGDIELEAASRIEKLEAALRAIIDRAEFRMGHNVTDAVCALARKALEGKDD
jgi:hypothetical protein